MNQAWGVIEMSHVSRNTPRGVRGNTPCRAALLLLAATVACTGCLNNEVDATYGRRRGAIGAASVNGTGVLARMFGNVGYRVGTWRRISPKLEQYKVIVWAPDDLNPPTTKQCERLYEWMEGGDEPRTLIYIGRDYDASITYWERVQQGAPANQVAELSRRAAIARALHDQGRVATPSTDYCKWFEIQRDHPRQTIRSLDDDCAWRGGIDPSKLEIHTESRIVPRRKLSKNFGLAGRRYTKTTLLSSNGVDLAFKIQGKRGQLIVVNNGSFLLNLPLVNHQHRLLAAKLVNECGEPGRVVFLESGPEGPPVFDEEPESRNPTGMEMFTVWPIGAVMMHFTVLGILVCFVIYPIFGRPRETPPETASDFGKHVQALGKELARTRDNGYAIQRLQTYFEHVKRESGVSHLDALKEAAARDQQENT